MRAALASTALAIALAGVLAACANAGVTSVRIDGGDRTLLVGDVVTLTATVVATGGASPIVAWTSDDETVATVDAAGQVTALAEGTADITATSVFDPTQSDAITLTVDAPGAALWTRQFGTTETELVRGVATDADGRVYVAGTTAGDLDGPNAGGADAFVRAYTTDGTERWTRQFGTTTDDWGTGIAVRGDVLYVTGYTAGDLDGSNAGADDAFVRAYDLDGQLQWGRLFGTGGTELVAAVATDADGNAYVAGQTSGALEATAPANVDAFVRAYAPDGVVLWTRQFGSPSDDRALAIAVDPTGTVVVAGDTLGALEGLNAGSYDAFVRAYDANGALQWTRQFGGMGADWVLGVATDADGNVYTAGATSSDLAGPSAGGFDVFVRAFDADGDFLWTRQFGSGGADSAAAVAADTDGNLTVVGWTRGGLDGANAGGEDAFIRSYDAAGTARWTRQFGTSGDDVAYDVALDAHGHAYVAGDTTGDLEGANLGFGDGFVRQHDR